MDNNEFRLLNNEEEKEFLIKTLNVFKQFCDSNSITFYLAYGTLLGSIRHKGFIPWDDDIDLWMLDSDYEKLKKSTLDKRLKLFDYWVDNKYGYPYGKISLNGTKIDNKFIKDFGCGVFLDIFYLTPVHITNEQIPRLKKRLRFYHNALVFCMMKRFWKGQNLIKNFVKFFVYSFSRMLGLDFWMKKHNAFLNKYRCSDSVTHYICDTDIIESKYFNKQTSVFFEGYEFISPADFDGLLTKIYGDYMTLPPEDSQVSSHDFEAYVYVK